MTTYESLLVKANARAQRRFHATLIAHDDDGTWNVAATALYMEAEVLVERLEIGPCPPWCPYEAGGDHDHADANDWWNR